MKITMKKVFSDSIKADIKGVIKVILHELELREIRAINGVVPLQISSKKFINAEDVVKIIKKINEGERHRVLRIFSEHEYNKAFSSNKITGAGITKLLNTRSTLDLCFGFGKEHAEEYLYFLIKDTRRLKKILFELTCPLLKKGENNIADKIQSGTQWKNIIIEFLNNEEILIKAPKYKGGANYKDLGLISHGKNPGPSMVWNFFRAMAQNNGEMNWSDRGVDLKNKKRKQILAKALWRYFGIEADPFYPYRPSSEKPNKSYKTWFILFCNKDYLKKLKEEPKKDNTEKPKNKKGIEDLEDFYKEQTPNL